MRHLHVCPLQSGHNGRAKIHTLHNGDQSLGDSIAAYDATENVYKDGGDFGIAGDEVEGLFNSLRSGSTTNIKEIGRGTTI